MCIRDRPQYPATAAVIAAPPAPSAAPTYDLFDYLCGDGRLYEVGGSGGQERFQTQRDGQRFYIVKNANWEELWADADYIWRGFDTSPDNDRYYIQKEDGREGARWANRRMRVGETVRGFGMVGWRSPWGESGVAEVHALHARPDNVRLRIPCMSRD